MEEAPQPQPFLPRVGMIWFFVVVTLVAMALGIVRAAEQGRSLAAALVLVAIFGGLYALFSALCFLAAFFLGAVEKAIVGHNERPASPFSDAGLPQQIVPPQPSERN